MKITQIKVNRLLKQLFKRKAMLLTALAISLLSTSCSKKMTKEVTPQDLETQSISQTEVQIFKNGAYTTVVTDEKPEPIQGEDQFYRDMYLELRYPAVAREKSIQGTVQFEIEIDEEGKVESITKTQSLSLECDIEAEKAIERGCKYGFAPYVFNGSKVRIKYIIPVKFKLQ